MLQGDFWYIFFVWTKLGSKYNLYSKANFRQKKFWNPKKLFDSNKNFKCKMELRSKYNTYKYLVQKNFVSLTNNWSYKNFGQKKLDLKMILVLKTFLVQKISRASKNFLVPIICRLSISSGLKFFLEFSTQKKFGQ